MKYFLSLSLLFFVGVNSLVLAQNNFPGSWIGNYKGDLLTYGVDSVKMKIKMELKIDRTKNDSIYKWTIIYDFKGKRDVRPYELLIIDRAKGLYKIDEKNSIVIESYLRNNVLTSFFQVMNSFIIATYTKMDDSIVFEIISSPAKPVSTTGNSKEGEEDIPEVITYPVNGRQKAVLYRVR